MAQGYSPGLWPRGYSLGPCMAQSYSRFWPYLGPFLAVSGAPLRLSQEFLGQSQKLKFMYLSIEPTVFEIISFCFLPPIFPTPFFFLPEFLWASETRVSVTDRAANTRRQP